MLAWFWAIIYSVCRYLVCQKLRSSITHGSITLITPDGDKTTFGSPGGIERQHATVHVKDNVFFWKVAANHDVGLFESFVDGDFEVSPSLDNLLFAFLANANQVDEPSWFSWIGTKIEYFVHAVYNANTIAGSRRNISAHYDLSNYLYEKMLDPSMTYSAALFLSKRDSLEQAQMNKLDAIISKARLQKTDHVLEIGSGWGSMAIRAASTIGCKVTTLTLSVEQKAEADRRIRAAGLEHLIEVRLEDYRHVQGTFDKVVSIEMIEAVGDENLPTYFQRIEELLKPNGLAVIQAITHQDAMHASYVHSSDWIKKYIFPGGCLLSNYRIAEAVRTTKRLQLLQLDDMGQHYARTLKLWQHNFEDNWQDIKASDSKFDERFYRMWHVYLVTCFAMLQCRYLSDVQFVLTRPQNRFMEEWTSEHEGVGPMAAY